MPMLNALPAGVDGFDDVTIWRILGVVVDNSLQFEQPLAETVSRGRSLFERVFYAAETAGFSLLITAAKGPLRVEPAVL